MKTETQQTIQGISRGLKYGRAGGDGNIFHEIKNDKINMIPVATIIPMDDDSNCKKMDEMGFLFAAAPEMLEALKGCLKDAEIMLTIEKGAKKDAWQYGIDRIKAVISKAEGK